MSKAETLFDAVQIDAAKRGSPLGYLGPAMRRARCFVLDASMSRFMADLATSAVHDVALASKTAELIADKNGAGVHISVSDGERAKVMSRLRKIGEGMRALAKAPHAVTWIEFDFHERYERYLTNYSAHGMLKKEFEKNHRSHYQKCGWLIEQLGDEAYRATTFMGDPGRDFSISPYCFQWCTDETTNPRQTFERGYVPLNLDTNMDGHYFTASHVCFGNPAMTGLGELVANPLTEKMPRDYVEQNMGEMRGELRYIWAMLGAINDLPTGIRRVERTRGFMARRNYQRFMDYSVITLILPKRMTEKKLARILVTLSRRRAHEVRGHFRLVGQDKKRIWIKEHIRGDASLGWVTHNYLVKHEGAQA